MTLTSVYEALNYHGDAVQPKEGQHDLRALAAEVVHRLPDEVRDWLLDETNHVFIGGSGQWGEFFDVWVHPTEFKEGFACLRIIFLSEQLMAMPKDDALFVIAHEIAHSWLGHGLDGARVGGEAETAADAQAVAWGFPNPSSMGGSMTEQDDPLTAEQKTREDPTDKEYAAVHWLVEDITERYHCTGQEAASFLATNQKWIAEAMCQAGWDFIEWECPFDERDEDEDE